MFACLITWSRLGRKCDYYYNTMSLLHFKGFQLLENKTQDFEAKINDHKIGHIKVVRIMGIQESLKLEALLCIRFSIVTKMLEEYYYMKSVGLYISVLIPNKFIFSLYNQITFPTKDILTVYDNL